MSKQQVVVSIDVRILEMVDQLTLDRDGAIEEALLEWCDRRRKAQIHRAMEARRQRQEQDETGWLV